MTVQLFRASVLLLLWSTLRDLAARWSYAGSRLGNSNLDTEESNLPKDLGIFLTGGLGGLLAPHPDGKRTTLLTYMTHQGR